MQNPQTNHAPSTDQVVLLVDQLESMTKVSNTTTTTTMSTTTDQPSVVAAAPRLNTPTKTKTLRRVNFSKPKSRFVETNYVDVAKTDYQQRQTTLVVSSSDESLFDSEDELSSSEEEEEEGGEDNAKANHHHKKRKKHHRKSRKRVSWRCVTEWVFFLVIVSMLISSLVLKRYEYNVILGLLVWQWCLMFLVILSGRLVSGWLVSLSVFLIERNFMLREKVLYFVYGLRRSFQNCIWLALVLLAWSIIPSQVQKQHKVLQRVFKALIAVFIGATIWLVKILLVKILASSFHVATFFDRMMESVFHHYILETLSGPPLDEPHIGRPAKAEKARMNQSKSLPARLKHSRTMKGSRRVDMEKLRKLSLESTTSAWSVKRLVNYIRSSGLSTISRTVDDFGKAESEISSEWEARTCAQRTFKNVAKSGAKYIEEEDLLRFLRWEEIHTIFPLFEGAIETGHISKSAFRNWVVRAYIERKALAHSLNDTKTAVQQLHKLASAVVVVIIVVVSLLVIGVATTKVLLVVSSQLVLVGFMFQNTCKTIFESIVFVFVMHPFDVGDRCVIDGVQMIVEEMNILTTVFLRYDNEKIIYPNSTLSTKPISNFYRSPEMSDTVDFTIDVSTSVDNINALKKQIQAYIESKPKHWNPKHSLLVKEIENVDKMKLTLCVLHTINHQNYGEKNMRRSELVLELKKIFENIGIKYHVLLQQIHLTQISTPTLSS